ncbi:MAG: dihydroneopterin aldolase family protein [Halanaeroarchaeum sp.]
MPTDAETAAFEAGIKFGALYHQFAGTPVSASSADSLEAAIEESIENQPHAREVSVSIDTDRLEAATDEHGYVELTGEYMTVEVVVEYDGTRAVAAMSMVDGYPLMELTSVERD